MKLQQIKTFTSSFAFLSLVAASSAFAAKKTTTKKTDAAKTETSAAAHEIDFKIGSMNGQTHWLPEKVDVKPGEKVVLVFKYDLKTGPEFHGIDIPALGIQGKVLRNQEARFNVTIPADLKEKEIVIKCQFHPAHQPAFLEVESAKKAK